jgi:hypothetical protein
MCGCCFLYSALKIRIELQEDKEYVLARVRVSKLFRWYFLFFSLYIYIYIYICGIKMNIVLGIYFVFAICLLMFFSVSVVKRGVLARFKLLQFGNL